MLPHCIPHWVYHLRLSFLICEMGKILPVLPKVYYCLKPQGLEDSVQPSGQGEEATCLQMDCGGGVSMDPKPTEVCGKALAPHHQQHKRGRIIPPVSHVTQFKPHQSHLQKHPESTSFTPTLTRTSLLLQAGQLGTESPSEMSV